MHRLILLCLPFLAASVQAYPETPAPYSLVVLPCDVMAANCRAIANWTPGANYNRVTDSTRVLWRNSATNAQLRRKYTDAVTDTLTVPRPGISSSLTGT